MKTKQLNNEIEVIVNSLTKEQCNNADFMFNLIVLDESMAQYASEKLKNNKSFALKMVKLHGIHLGLLPYDLRQDKEIVLAAVKENGDALNFAGPSWQNNKEIVSIAIKTSPTAIQYAYPALQDDKELAIKAIEQDSDAFLHISSRLKNDLEVAMLAFKKYNELHDNLLFFNAGPDIKNNIDIAYFAVRINEINANFIGEDLKAQIGNNNALQYLGAILLSRDLDNILESNTLGNAKRRKI